MVFVKVRETYDLCTVKNKMTIIGIHTPKTDIIKRNYPGLLMQCRAYRPASCRVAISCASVLPLDPLGVGTANGDVAPEDVFNPILYKAMSNFGMSQLEARIEAMSLSPGSSAGGDVDGSTAMVDVDTTTELDDEFPIYYGLLANSHDWKKANAQSGLEMNGLRPLVYETLYNVGDNSTNSTNLGFYAPGTDGAPTYVTTNVRMIRGNAKTMPFINTTLYSNGTGVDAGWSSNQVANMPKNSELEVPYIKVICGAIIIPPSRLHQLFYRMVVEWDIEFSSIRPLGEITNWTGLAALGTAQHYQNYDYEATKEAVTGSTDTVMDSDTCMVSTNADIKKVM